MDERYSQPFALIGKIGRPMPVNRKGGLRFRFGLIDSGIGRAVYQKAGRTDSTQDRTNAFPFRYIDQGDVQRCNFETGAFQRLNDLPAEHPAVSNDYDITIFAMISRHPQVS
jgi:hypothetical protein